MDSTGVPKKINRHVYKTLLKGTELNIANILDSVKYSMRDLVPVENFEDAVQRSLYNFEQNGIVTKEGNNFKITLTTYNYSDKTDKNANEIKKRKFNDSDDDDDKDNSIIKSLQKQVRGENFTFDERKGKNVDLPKVNKSDISHGDLIETKVLFDDPNVFGSISSTYREVDKIQLGDFNVQSECNPTRKLDTIIELEEDKYREEKLKTDKEFFVDLALVEPNSMNENMYQNKAEN